MAAEISTSDYGEEFWFGGMNGQTIHVGDFWMAGCRKPEAKTWEMLQQQAALIAVLLSPDTVEQQMACAVLTGDTIAAKALADKITNGE